MLPHVLGVISSLVSLKLAMATVPPNQRVLAASLKMKDSEVPVTSGTAPFTISFNGALAETYYMIFGDLKNTEQVPLVVGHGGGGTHHYLASRKRLLSYRECTATASTGLD